MPTYDYECDACDYQMELFQGINDPVKKKCPKCGKNKLRRLFGGGAAIVFKGSGFYQTDYRSDSYKKAAKAEQGGSKSGSGKSADKKTAGSGAASGANASGAGDSGGKSTTSSTDSK